MYTRRQALACTLALLPVPVGACRPDLGAALRHLRDPVAIGRRYLSVHPGELAAARRVAEALAGDAVAAGQAMRADFAEGRVRVVDGWVLSLTEVRLAAVLAVS
jgi:hypothetical protein